MSSSITISEAKKHLTIFDLWVLLDLPGKPGKSCRCPWRQDQHPSFSVYGHGTRWKDFSTGDSGDTVDFLALVTGLNSQAACHEFLKMAHGGSPQRRCPNAIREPKPAAGPSREVTIETGEGEARDWELLASQRGLSIEAIKLAMQLGLLKFGLWRERRKADGVTARWRETKCWFITDATKLLTQARRMDGRPWWPNGPKAQNSPGSQAGWIINAEAASNADRILLLEGGADLLAAIHLIHQLGLGDSIAPVGILGANIVPQLEAVALLAGKQITIVPHHDQPKDGQPPVGAAAADRWANLLTQNGCIVDVKSVAPNKDLNELIVYGKLFTL